MPESGTGRSQYSSAFTHPDPMDPNDVQRQRTQSRAGNFPYDTPVMYGSDEVPDDAGAKRQVGYGGQLTPWFVPHDDGDIEKEASETPYNFGQSDRGAGGAGGLAIPGQSRGFAGATKDDLDLPHQEVFGEDSFVQSIMDGDLRDLQTGELRDISTGGGLGLAGQGLQPQANQRPGDNLVDSLGMDEDVWPQEVRSRQLRSLNYVSEYEDLSLGECFAVYNEESDEVVSLLETLDWE